VAEMTRQGESVADGEIVALKAIEEKVLTLPLDAQARIAQWLSERVRSDKAWALEIERQHRIAKGLEIPDA
jgi:hypothetical protein